MGGSGSTANIIKYYYAGGQRIAVQDSAGLKYIHTDHLSSTSRMSNAAGAAIRELHYDPWGSVAADEGGSRMRYTYTGQGQEVTGLYDYQARLYDPRLGRFTQPDSIVPNPGDPQALNRYSYVLNNPLKYVDPSGHANECGYTGGGGCGDGNAIYDYAPSDALDRVAAGTEVLASVIFEPADWAVTARDCLTDNCSAFALVGLLPLVPSSIGKYGDEVVESITDVAKRVRVYRVEGAVNRRISILEGGLVEVVGDKTLFLNFGDERRALEFFEKRVSQGMDDAIVKSFEVSAEFLGYLRRNAVPEQLAREFPDMPIVVDITKSADQYGLRPEQFEQLINAIVQGSGQIWP